MIKRNDLRKHPLIKEELHSYYNKLKEDLKNSSKCVLFITIMVLILMFCYILFYFIVYLPDSLNFKFLLKYVSPLPYVFGGPLITELAILLVMGYRYIFSGYKIIEGTVIETSVEEVENDGDSIDIYIVNIDNKNYFADYSSIFENIQINETYIFLLRGRKIVGSINKDMFE